MFQKATKSLLQRVSLVLRRSKLRGSARDENLGTVVLVFAYNDSSSIMVAETYVGINRVEMEATTDTTSCIHSNMN